MSISSICESLIALETYIEKLKKYRGWVCKKKKCFTASMTRWRILLASMLLFSHSVMSDSALPWTAARKASLSFTVSWSLLKLMSIELVMPSNRLILITHFFSCPQSFPASGSFPMSWLFTSGGQIIQCSASVLPMDIQNWSPLGWTGLISLQSKRLSRVSSSITIWKHQFFSAQLSLWSNSHICTWLPEKP